jgi:hypothetical protein
VNDADVVADASAIIALLVGEPFTRFDPVSLLWPSMSGRHAPPRNSGL